MRVISTAGESNLWQLTVASSAWEAMEKLQSDLAVDLLLVDLPSDDADGFHCLRWLRKLRSALPILLIDRNKLAGTKLHSIRVDSNDYLVAPLAASQLQTAVVRSVAAKRDGSAMDIAPNGVEQPGNGLLFIGASPKMHRVTAQVALLADADLPVFISGEPGSGKEAIARLLHQLSARSESVFASVDCAALSNDLLEREIFGYEPPRDVRAAETTSGKLELSAGGTLFLNEIEEMPLQLQLKLATVMESGRMVRTGSSHAAKIDVRVVVSSSLPTDRANSEHKIVPELSRQFGNREVRVPPLRERKEELPILARHYMHQLSRQFGLAPKEFAFATEEAWQSYQWPGNLRELKQSVKRILIAGETVSETKKLPPDQVSEVVKPVQPQVATPNPPVVPVRQSVTDIGGYKTLRSMVRSVREEAERAAIASALEKTGWNRKAAARLLKVSYRSILYKIEQYQMNTPHRATVAAPERFVTDKSKPAAAIAKAHWV